MITVIPSIKSYQYSEMNKYIQENNKKKIKSSFSIDHLLGCSESAIQSTSRNVKFFKVILI